MTSQSPSVEFKGQRQRRRTEIDSLNLDVDSARGGGAARRASKQLMSCGFLRLCRETARSSGGKTEQPGNRDSGPGMAGLGEREDWTLWKCVHILASMLLPLVNTH